MSDKVYQNPLAEFSNLLRNVSNVCIRRFIEDAVQRFGRYSICSIEKLKEQIKDIKVSVGACELDMCSQVILDSDIPYMHHRAELRNVCLFMIDVLEYELRVGSGIDE